MRIVKGRCQCQHKHKAHEYGTAASQVSEKQGDEELASPQVLKCNQHTACRAAFRSVNLKLATSEHQVQVEAARVTPLTLPSGHSENSEVCRMVANIGVAPIKYRAAAGEPPTWEAEVRMRARAATLPLRTPCKSFSRMMFPATTRTGWIPVVPSLVVLQTRYQCQ